MAEQQDWLNAAENILAAGSQQQELRKSIAPIAGLLAALYSSLLEAGTDKEFAKDMCARLLGQIWGSIAKQ